MPKFHAIDPDFAARVREVSKRHSLVLTFGGATLILVFVAMIMSFLVTVTHEDAVYYLNRKSAILLSNPKPGALYAVDDQQIYGSYLCELELKSVDIVGFTSPPRYYEFYNKAGMLLPIIAKLNILLGGSKNLMDMSKNEVFYRKWQIRDLTFIGSDMTRRIREDCEPNVSQAINVGMKVCRVDAVMSRYSDGAPYAVKFNNFCIVKCADGTSCSSKEKFPQLDDVAWSIRLKRQLNLIAGGPVDPERPVNPYNASLDSVIDFIGGMETIFTKFTTWTNQYQRGTTERGSI